MNPFSPITRLWRSITASSVSMRMGGLELLRAMLGGRPARTNKNVNVESALQVTVVFAVLQRIAFGFAQVPWKTFRDRAAPARGRDEAKDHTLYELLHLKPNDWQTSFAFRVTLILHLLLTGNFFAFINRVNGKIVELIPLEPERVEVERQPDYSFRYTVRGTDGSRKPIPADAMWHIRGPSWNSWMGLEAVKLAREAIGLTMAAEETQIELQKRGAKMPGVLAMEGNLTAEQYDDLSKWLKGNALVAYEELGIILVDHAAKFQSVAMSGIDAQTLETRRHQVEEVCRHFNLMPVMIGHPADMAARAAMEQIFIAHVVHCLDPLYVCVEQSADMVLLTKAERAAGMYTRFIRAGLMRGDMKAQAEWFAKAIGQGATGKGQAWATANDIRDLIEWNPIDGGDTLSEPQAAASAAPKPKPATDPTEPEDDA